MTVDLAIDQEAHSFQSYGSFFDTADSRCDIERDRSANKIIPIRLSKTKNQGHLHPNETDKQDVAVQKIKDLLSTGGSDTARYSRKVQHLPSASETSSCQ